MYCCLEMVRRPLMTRSTAPTLERPGGREVDQALGVSERAGLERLRKERRPTVGTADPKSRLSFDESTQRS